VRRRQHLPGLPGGLSQEIPAGSVTDFTRFGEAAHYRQLLTKGAATQTYSLKVTWLKTGELQARQIDITDGRGIRVDFEF
jgi:hypothetical protein